MPRLLAVFAHPDDESFGVAGTMALYASRGVDVFVVSATRGESGPVTDPSLVPPGGLARVREEELRRACETVGAHPPLFLGYRDSGMAGTPENDHPESLARADPAEVVARLLEVMRRIRPDVVVTFDEKGIYGHPDHVAVHRHATEAFHRYAAENPSARLYYHVLPLSLVRRLTDERDPDSPFRGVRPEDVGTPDEAVTCVVDVSAFLEVKRRAILCHRTQVTPEGLEEMLGRAGDLLARECFVRVWPEAPPGEREEGLFP